MENRKTVIKSMYIDEYVKDWFFSLPKTLAYVFFSPLSFHLCQKSQ